MSSQSLLAKTLEDKQAQSTFGWCVDESGAFDTGDGVRWLAKDQELLLSTYYLKHYIENPTLPMHKELALQANPESEALDMDDPNMDPGLKAHLERALKQKYPDWSPPEKKHVENAKKLNIKVIRRHEDTNFLLKYNPMLNGAMVLQLALKTEEAGVALANHHLSIFAAAHLYNALRQQNLIDFAWPAMERIVDVHN